MPKPRIRMCEEWPAKGELWLGVPFGKPRDVGHGIMGTPGEVGKLMSCEWSTDESGDVTTLTYTFHVHERERVQQICKDHAEAEAAEAEAFKPSIASPRKPS